MYLETLMHDPKAWVIQTFIVMTTLLAAAELLVAKTLHLYEYVERFAARRRRRRGA